MASLASAACVCKRWGRVASDPAVFRRFGSLRRPPLVGVLVTDRGREKFPLYYHDTCFIKAPSRNNPELASAAANGDFYFMHHPDVDDDDEWRLRGCDGGFLLFSLGRYSTDLAVYDPLDRTAVFFKPPHDFRPFRYAIVADEADASFQVIAIQPDPWGDDASVVFSSRTRSWVENGSVRYRFAWPYTDGIAAGRFAYWRSNTKKDCYCEPKEEILVVDTKTMVWSYMTAPAPVGESYCVAHMPEHGGLCIVSSKEQRVLLWVSDANGGWVVKKEVSLLNHFPYLKKLRRDQWMKRVRILAMRAGYVYMEFWSIRKTDSYLLVLNLNTVKLEIFLNNGLNNEDRPYRGPAFPFFLRMAPLPAADDDKKLQDA
ncbi:uncharacterized protein [Aegilops tauschii subsp. strangulata]|uniref:uncharacterized protein n=1 Tax=Aegilops tauschii subsp. strangulata TaxID=200361 RepID=UPI00098A6A0F|nr:uncharacterized protein LOC109757678 [Aegilops tauschii subsp. strangulata]XP_020172102.1 uncharacterized protein LOC109757678 [Aegilops tauschii subsp. strangulata]